MLDLNLAPRQYPTGDDTFTSGDEAAIRAAAVQILNRDFYLFEEVPVRHAFFTHRVLRVDLLAIPRDPAFAELVFAIETKSDQWLGPKRMGQAFKQASDYVLSTVEPDRPTLHPYVGKRILGAFVAPSPAGGLHSGDEGSRAFYNMGILAAHSRVGWFRINGEIELHCGSPIWSLRKGWYANRARDTFLGARQIGSQRHFIVDEIAQSGERS